MRRVRRNLVLIGGLLILFPTRAAHAQVAPTPVDFRPFSDARFWIVKQPLVYRVGISRDSVVVPRGFVTDFASIPPVLQSLIQQNSANLLPAVVHDFLYWTQVCTRVQSDQLLKLAMIENRVATAQRVAIYAAVRAVGSFAWDSDRAERQRGMVHLLPESRLNVPPLADWQAYQATMKVDGIVDAPYAPISPGFCHRGDMSVEGALQTR